GIGSRPRLRRAVRFALIAFVLIVIAAIAGAAVLIASLGPALLGKRLSFSTLVVDRDGRLLRPYTTEAGRWRLPATRASVDPRFLSLLLAYEDKRFLDH